MIGFEYSDGGRAAAGFKGYTGDCVVRALTIASDEDYRVVYDELHDLALGDRGYMASLELRYGPQARRHASPRDGVARKIYDAWLEQRGWIWTPTMHIGMGCKVHLSADELPSGRLVVRLSRHLAAVVDGVLYDTYDCSRDGTRCVYGYFSGPA